jgi:glycosyltransferase involved in cell wall biosynthesis
MKIALDLRGLHSGKISGVENYIINIFERLLYMDHDNRYLLFENAYSPKSFEHLKFVNTEVVHRRVPNKLLNLSLKFLGQPKFENFFGEFDCLFLPNLNFFAIKPGTKLVVTVHDLSPVVAPEYFNFKRRVWHHLINFKKTLRRADHIIAVSEYTKADIIRLFAIPSEKVSVVYSGIDRSLFRPNLDESKLREVRNIYGLPGQYILFLNTIEPRKNLANFIKAFERVDTPAALVIGGKKGWKHREIFATINASPKRRLIKYLGYVPEEHKPYLISLAKAIGYTSFYEGFGFPALEALSVGVPVIASQVTAIPESVEDAALLVNPYSVEDIASGLRHLLTDEELRQQLKQKGFAQVQKFDWNTSAEQLLAIFNKLR